jgi:hypothetical protein
MPTIWAHGMRQTHFTTIAALHQLSWFQTIICPPAIPTTFGNFAFWKRTHFYSCKRLRIMFSINKLANYTKETTCGQGLDCSDQGFLKVGE